MEIKALEIILFVRDQSRSSRFYERLLGRKPDLEVPGMTEFNLYPGLKLGLMPETGIAKIICPKMPLPAQGNGIPRAELYLSVADVDKAKAHAVACGANLVDDLKVRDWGDRVCYFSDPDGNILAFAEPFR